MPSETPGAFPGVELRATPSVGNLFNLDVFVYEAITRDAKIAFNAGSHTA